MPDSSQATDPWAWVPDSWRDAGEVAADKLASAGQTLGLTSPDPAPVMPVVPPPVDDSLAGAPGAPGAPLPPVAMPTVPPPAPPLPDAISGAGGIPVDAVTGAPQIDQQPPIPAPQHPDQALAPIPTPDVATPGGATNDSLGVAPQTPASVGQGLAPTAEQEQKRIAGLTDEQLLTEKFNNDEAQRHMIAAEKLRAARESMESERKNYDDLVASHQIAQQRSDAMVAEAQKLSQRKIDPDGRSTFSKIRGVVSAFVNGLVAPYNGGRNVGLEMIQKEIDGNVAAQQKDIENGWKGIATQQGAIADSYRRSGDMYQAAEAHRLALWKGTIDMIDQAQQERDPNGSQYLNLEMLKRQARANAMQLQLKYGQEQQKAALEKGKANREQQDLILRQQQAAEAARHNKADEAHANWATAIEGKKAQAEIDAKTAENQVYTPEQLTAVYGAGAPVPPIPMSPKQYGVWLENRGKGQEQGSKASEAEGKLAAGSILNPITGAPLTRMKDGKEVPIVTTDTEATKVKDTIVGAQNFLDAASAARRMLEKEPSLVSRDEWAQVTTNLEAAKVAYIKMAGAKPSSREMEAVSEMFGSNFDDFTSRVKNKGTGKAHIDTLINTVKRETATDLKQRLGYTGPDVLGDTSKPPEATKDDIDKIQENLKTDLNAEGGPKPTSNALSPQLDEYAAYPWSDAVKKKYATQAEVDRGKKLGIIPPKLRLFDALTAAMQGSDPTAKERAIGVLQNEADNGDHEAERRYAAQLLANQQLSEVPLEPTTGVP